MNPDLPVNDQEHDIEGWLGEGVDCWAMWDVLMDEFGQVTRLSVTPRGETIEVICWAPTSGMLRKRVKP